MLLESHTASKVLYNFARINSGICSRGIKPRNAISVLCNCVVCNIARGHNVSNFLTLYLCSDLSLCTVDFEINKVFDFKINQVELFLVNKL